MTVEEVKTRFTADVEKYKKDIQSAQKVLQTFITASDTSLNKRQAAEFKLQNATQKTLTAQANAAKAEMQWRSKAASSLQSTIKGTNEYSASTQSLGQSMYYMARRVALVVTAVKQFGNILSTGMNFNQIKEDAATTFSVMYRSIDVARAKLQEMYNFSVKSPLTFKETISSAKQLAAYGFGADRLIPTMQTLGTVAKATGHSMDDIAYIYGTLKTQGRAYSRDLQQFGMRGIPIYEELATIMKVNVKDIQKMASEGKIGFREVEKAFQNMTSNGGRFAGMLEEYMNTLTGKTSQLSDMWENSLGKMLKWVFEETKKGVSDLIIALDSPVFQEFSTNMGNALGSVAAAFFSIVNALVRMLPLLSTFLKLWIAIKALNIAKDILGKMPALLLNIAQGLMGASSALASGALFTGFQTLGSNISFAAMALKNFAVAAAAFAAANPWLLALTAVGVVGGAMIKSGIANAAENKKLQTNKEYATEQITTNIKEQLDAGYKITDNYEKQVMLVKALDAKTALTAKEVANLLSTLGVIDTQTLGKFDLSSAFASLNTESKKLEQWMGGEWEGVINGVFKKKRDIRVFEALSINPNDIWSMAEPSAAEYMKAFKSTLASEDVLKNLIASGAKPEVIAEEQARVYGERYKQVLEGFTNIVAEFQNTGDKAVLKASLAELLNYYQQLADGAKKKQKEIQRDAFWLREWIAKNTSAELDDLQLERDKAYAENDKKLAEQQINHEEWWKAELIIAQYYTDKINQSLYDSLLNGNNAFWNDLQKDISLNIEKGNMGTAAGQSFLSMFKGTQSGNVMSNAGSGGGGMMKGIVMQFIQAAIEFIQSIEEVNAAMNPFKTFFEAMRELLEPLINDVFEPIVDLIQSLGKVVAKIIAPVFQLLGIINRFTYFFGVTLMPIFELIGKVFTGLMDYVIVPVGNALVDVMNQLIWVMNKYMGASIEYIDHLQTSWELVADSTQMLTDSMEYAVDKLNELIDTQIATWKDLYEVGAITGAEYASQTAALNAKRVDLDQQMLDTELLQLTTIEDIYAWIQAHMEAYLQATDEDAVDKYDADDPTSGEVGATTIPGSTLVGIAAGLVTGDLITGIVAGWITSIFGFASGSSYIPNDMTANLHKGEGVIPATFMDSIRAGELSLSGKNSAQSATITNNYIEVGGSVISENELVDLLAKKTSLRTARGYI